jgi:predicted ATPase
MITRLQVRGFKNLTDVDVRFGPLTCVAGPNGVGKSNLFDVIALLSSLAAGRTLDTAAGAIRGTHRRQEVRHLFQVRSEGVGQELSLEVEMIVPRSGHDFLLKPVTASNTFLRYELRLVLAPGAGGIGTTLRIAHEELSAILPKSWERCLAFESTPAWRDSVLHSTREGRYVRTEGETNEAVVKMFADTDVGRGRGRPTLAYAADLPQTMLSTAQDGAAHPTAVLARREMMSWIQLALEPSALRASDELHAPVSMDENGRHLARLLFTLQQRDANTWTRVANHLAELVEEVRSVRVELDEKRELLTVMVTDRYGVELPASGLSDGMLRFLALAVMLEDPAPRGVICLEEPENGVHPRRVPIVLDLLRKMVVSLDHAVDADNPLRQVMLNTHSPIVVAQVLEDELLLARAGATLLRSPRLGLTLLPLPGTWRATEGTATSTRGEILEYLQASTMVREVESGPARPRRPRRVVESPSYQGTLFPLPASP